MLQKSFVGPKYFDKLKPEPDPKNPPRLVTLHQLCTMSKVSF